MFDLAIPWVAAGYVLGRRETSAEGVSDGHGQRGAMPVEAPSPWASHARFNSRRPTSDLGAGSQCCSLTAGSGLSHLHPLGAISLLFSPDNYVRNTHRAREGDGRTKMTPLSSNAPGAKVHCPVSSLRQVHA